MTWILVILMLVGACAVTGSAEDEQESATRYVLIASSPVVRSWQCPLAVTGTIAQMIAALTLTTDTDDGVHRVLPGAAIAYDSISGRPP